MAIEPSIAALAGKSLPAIPARTVTVSLVEDSQRMREGFAAVLNKSPGIRCLAAYGSGEEAVAGLPLQPTDVALVDVNLPGMNGIECVAQLKSQLPQLEILMLTRYEQSDLIFASLRAGASGYLLKSVPPQELAEAIRQVCEGGSPMSMQIARKVTNFFRNTESPASELGKLTARENEILQALAKGCSYQEIADQLGLSLCTVRSHLHSVYLKLHVRTRAQAVVKLLGKS